MTRCQMRTQRLLRELHEAYDKHDYQVVARIRWQNEDDKVHMCPCGCFAAVDDLDNKGAIIPVSASICGAWIERAYWALNNRDKESFKAYLKRISWQADTKKLYHLIYGGKGRSLWQVMYGQAQSKAEYDKLQEMKNAH